MQVLIVVVFYLGKKTRETHVYFQPFVDDIAADYTVDNHFAILRTKTTSE